MSPHHTLSRICGPWVDSGSECGFIEELRVAWDQPIESLSNRVLAICLRQRLAIDDVLAIARVGLSAQFDDDSEMHETKLRDAVEETEYWRRADDEDRRIRGLPPRKKNG